MVSEMVVYGVTTLIAVLPVGILYAHFMHRLRNIKRANGFEEMDDFIKKGNKEKRD